MADDEDLRVALYRALATTGRVPRCRALAGSLGLTGDDVRAGLRRCTDARHVVLRPDLARRQVTT